MRHRQGDEVRLRHILTARHLFQESPTFPDLFL
jgi:hypothetical protein